MNHTELPVDRLAYLYAAIQQAMAYTVWDGPAPNERLWKELNGARSIVKIYLLQPANAVGVEFTAPVKVPE